MPRKSEHTGILRRGSACLSCRRRKLRCDGARPVCNQCNLMSRRHECAYDDSCRKSRTQTLREKMFALEAKVRELEQGGQPQVLSSLSPFGGPINDGYGLPISSSIPQFDPSYDALDPLYPMLPQSWSLFDYSYDGQVSSGSSPSNPNIPIPVPVNTAMSHYIDAAPIIRTQTLTDSSGTPTQDGFSDRLLTEPNVVLTVELHNTLIGSFIEHRKQCCFYSNTTRFDPSSSATVYQNTPPNSALMSAIYLLGSFFARLPLLEKQLLDQSLHELSRSFHNQEQLMDAVQASCLLAQYLYFCNRPMEGSVHLTTAKRMAQEFGLNQVSYSAFPFDLEYPLDSSYDPSERAAIFWQLFMVEKFWSASNDCFPALPDSDFPCQNITTPLPVLEGVEMESVAGNSTIHALFEADHFEALSLSVPGFKIMASCIFDRSLRVHNSSASAKDATTWAYHRSAELALQRLSTLVHPFTWQDNRRSDEDLFDTDLYAVHSLITAATVHLHLDNIMNLKISLAAKKLVELVHHLRHEDYQFLDPVLSICWSSIIRIFRRMIENANRVLVAGTSTSTYTVAFLGYCVDVLLGALKSLSNYVPIADSLLTDLDNAHTPFHTGLNKTLPSFVEKY